MRTEPKFPWRFPSINGREYESFTVQNWYHSACLLLRYFYFQWHLWSVVYSPVIFQKCQLHVFVHLRHVEMKSRLLVFASRIKIQNASKFEPRPKTGETVCSMEESPVGSVFLPGDCLQGLKQSESSGRTILGPGLKKEDEEVRVIKPGVLRFKEPNVYWIDSHQKRVRS